MIKMMFAAAFFSFVALSNTHAAGTDQHGEPYKEKAAPQQAVQPDAKEKAPADGKRLPGRDCKLYQGKARQHVFPEYEIGNPNRPECPPETK